MRNPHVVSLHYRIETEGPHQYDSPIEKAFTTHLGRFILNSGKLTLEVEQHFDSESAARRPVDAFLRAWEVDCDIRWGIGSIRFRFDRSHVIDLSPKKPGEVSLSGTAAIRFSVSGALSAVIARSEYPEPPNDFQSNVDVEAIYARWSNFKQGKETLPAVAYAVLTYLENLYSGNRANAARALNFSGKILDTIGKLSALGDLKTARKFHEKLRPLTTAEEQWLDEAIRLIIRRCGQRGANLPQATLADLPPI